ncbi:MAG TPA: acetoin utilization protein acuB [Flavobacteriaceae bacterium]|nr:acetoin utilization protein acuB [Flavobacteriaceae bacterium]
MDCTNFIIHDHKPFDLEDKLIDVRETLSHCSLSHVLVTQEDLYLGALSETDALCLDPNMALSEIQYALTPFFVRPQNSWFEILEAFAQHQTNIMPVINEQGLYQGYYELSDIMHLFHSTPFLSAEGVVLIVGRKTSEYSLAELTQILESNGGHLFGAFVSQQSNDHTQVTLKVSSETITTCIEALRRYGFDIISVHEKDSTLNQLKERSEYLDKYLNI